MVTKTVTLERAGDLELALQPRATTAVTLRLLSPGVPYWERADLGIGKGDVRVQGKVVTVKVHSLGSVDAPATEVAVLDSSGTILATAPVPAIPAPLDLFPKTAEITLKLPAGARQHSVAVDPGGTIPEITRTNNIVRF
jgi:hypothetical protein